MPGFVVNRLLFPFLFDAVACTTRPASPRRRSTMTCPRMGAGHPMASLALLDYVGLDVAAAIGAPIVGTRPPPSFALAAGALGKRAGAGFYT